MVSLTELIKEPPAVSHPTVQNSKSARVTFEVKARDSDAAPDPFPKY